MYVTLSLVPRLSWNSNMYLTESLVSFLRKHDVIKIGPKQKGNILRVVQPTMSSMLGVYDIRPPIADTCIKLPATFAPFLCCASRVCPRTIKFSLPPLYLWRFSRDKKYQALHACTTSMFVFRSVEAWERGYVTLSSRGCVLHSIQIHQVANH